ncbi:MAG: LysR substrate-binding domain-containing protein [Hyphomicrobiaceae bacterium]
MAEPTLKQLKYFLAVAEYRHFGQAATQCAVTQPALSMQIQELERIVGAPLIERTRHGAYLTAAGTRLAERAALVIHQVRDLVDDARQQDRILLGPLRLGVIPSIAPYLLPPLLPRLKDTYPDLDLHVRESQTERLLEELTNGRLDALILALPVNHEDITTEPLFDDRFLLARPKVDKAGVKCRAADEALQSKRLLLLEEGHCLRDQILSYCSNHAVRRVDTFEAASLTTIVQLVANNFGITLVPEICAPVESRDFGIQLNRFTDPEPFRTVALAWRRSSPRLRDFDAIGMAVKAVGRDILESVRRSVDPALAVEPGRSTERVR